MIASDTHKAYDRRRGSAGRNSREYEQWTTPNRRLASYNTAQSGRRSINCWSTAVPTRLLVHVPVDQMFEHFLPAADVGGDVPFFEHVTFERFQVVFVRLDFGADPAIPT